MPSILKSQRTTYGMLEIDPPVISSDLMPYWFVAREPSTLTADDLKIAWRDFFPLLRERGLTEPEIRDYIRAETDLGLKAVLVERYQLDFDPTVRTDIEQLIYHPETEGDVDFDVYRLAEPDLAYIYPDDEGEF